MDSNRRPPRKVKYPPNPRRAVKPSPLAKSEAVKEGGADEDENRTKHLEKKEYKEPWDYDLSYYPTSLPWRKPLSGDPDLLDEKEFGEAASTEYDENSVKAASELGLQEKVDDTKLYLFQFPYVPFESPTSTATDRMGTEVPQHTSAGSDMSTTSSSMKACKLEELPAGRVGKLLVYKSGKIKLKMGDIPFDVSHGTGSSFAQEVVAVNTKEKQCCSLGEPNKTWAVVTPDVVSLFDNNK